MARKRKYLLVAYGLDVVLLLLLICVPYATMIATKNAASLIGRARDVREALMSVTSAVSDVTIERANYLLTHNPSYLNKVAEKTTRLTQRSQVLVPLVTDNPAQASRVDRLLELVGQFNATMLRHVDQVDADDTLQRAFRVADGETHAREIKAAAEKIDAAEETLLAHSRQAFSQKTSIGIIVSLVLGLSAAVGLFWLLLRFRQELIRREALETELIKAQQAAEAAGHQKAYFLAAMSHEIRAPLGAMLGYAELLTDPGTPTEERLEYITTIVRNGRHLSQVVDDVLDLSKFEAGALVVANLPCRPAEIIGDVIKCLAHKARVKAIHLRAETLGDMPPAILTDAKIIRQILLNLVGNAIKFTDSGEVVVRCHGQVDASTKQLALDIAVSDTGRGINECDRTKLFKEFSQCEASIGRLYGGTGLGLALSRNLARALKGDLMLRASKFGGGSTFALTLRADIVAVKQIAASEAVSTVKGALAGRALTGKCILLADDAPDNQFLIGHILRASGAKVDVVGDGIGAVESAMTHAYDVVLMDIQMPHLDGYAATAQLRQRGYDRPILALSAHAMQAERHKSIASGCNDHICKPVDRRALIDAVVKHCPRTASALH